MTNKWLRKLGMGISILMTFSQLSGIVVMAAPGDDFGDALLDRFEAEQEDNNNEENDDISLSKEDIDLVNVDTSYTA